MKDVSKEVKQLRKESFSLRDQNKKYKKALASLKFYLDKLGTAENVASDLDSNSVGASFISQTNDTSISGIENEITVDLL
tara:strand:- start:61 stop:300 length:240 start_codon:yes stop_codon:yes gene_type:complete